MWLDFRHRSRTTRWTEPDQSHPCEPFDSHPWSYGNLIWMHNGCIADFHKIKRRLQNDLSDEMFSVPQGNTDSEWSFACFLDQLSRVCLRCVSNSTRPSELSPSFSCADNRSQGQDDSSCNLAARNACDGRQVEGLYARMRRRELRALVDEVSITKYSARAHHSGALTTFK